MDNGHWRRPVRLFTSKNLIDWEFNSILKYKDGSNIVAECPDFFPLKTENSDETMWVFQGAGRFYVVGNLRKDDNGKYQFKASTEKQTYLSDNTTMYAAQTFFNDPKGRRIAIFWLIDLYSKSIDEGMSKIWDGVQSLPLELKLYNIDGSYVIKVNTVEELVKLRGRELFSCNNVLVKQGDNNALEEIRGTALEIEAIINIKDAGRTNLVFRKGNEEKTVLVYNSKSQNLSLVCKDSGVSSETTSVKVQDEDGRIKLHIVIDNTVVDVFVNDGIKVLSGHIFSSEASDGLEFTVQDGNAVIESLKVYELSSIWTEEGNYAKTTQGLKTLDYILIVAVTTFITCFIICVTVIRIKKTKRKEVI